jgi:hypothetical protein
MSAIDGLTVEEFSLWLSRRRTKDRKPLAPKTRWNTMAALHAFIVSG